jgi:hypothetical protein
MVMLRDSGGRRNTRRWNLVSARVELFLHEREELKGGKK